MKFKYENKEKENECVAYMTHMIGKPDKQCLVIKGSNICSFWLYFDGEIVTHSNEWRPNHPDVTHKFYPGDKVEITF